MRTEYHRALRAMRDAVRGEAFPGLIDDGDIWWERDPYHVLIATVLSQRTKDINTYRASSDLFRSYYGPKELMEADPEDVMELIRSTGLYRGKTRAIIEIARRIVEDHGGEVPGDIDEMTKLPMVGRKTANCVMAYGFRRPAICVDTHVHRIANRIGWVETGTPDRTEAELRMKVPKALWCDINSTMVRFGQRICLPRGPHCRSCPVNHECKYFQDNNRP